jgi:hypothetical protein
MELVDIRIMGYFNLIIDLKNEAVEEEGDEDYKVTNHCNMLQYIIGPISNGNFGYHSDASPAPCCLLTDKVRKRRFSQELMIVICQQYQSWEPLLSVTLTALSQQIQS